MKVLKITGKTLLIIVVIAVIILMAVLLFLAFYPGVGKTPDKQIQSGFAEKTDKSYDIATPRIGQPIDYDSISEHQEQWWEADTEGTPAKGNNSTEADIEEETETAAAAEEVSAKIMQMKIGDIAVDVAWEENESVEALKKFCTKEPLTIKMSMYGSFEQVGSIGSELPRNDRQTTTSAGDIVLYSGNHMVVFYGSNSWSYTRLGHITDKNADEMAELLGSGNVTITIFLD